MQPGGDGGLLCQGAFFTWKPSCLHVQWNPTAGQRRVPVWPLCMETLRPMHLNSVQQALADWCAHIHTCALHVHMGSFTSMGWACLLVVEAQHVHDQWASHATTRAPGHTCAFTAEFGLLWDTHPGGQAELHTWRFCPLFLRESHGVPCALLASASPPSPLLLLFLPGPSCCLCFYRS